MGASLAEKISRDNAKLAKAVDELKRDLATKLAENPSHFGGETLDLRIQDGRIASVGTSVETNRIP